MQAFIQVLGERGGGGGKGGGGGGEQVEWLT